MKSLTARWWEKFVPFYDVPFYPGEIEQRFGRYFEIERIAGKVDYSMAARLCGLPHDEERRNGMKGWLTSLNGAITLSGIAWLTELWRAWLDMLFEYPGGFVQAEIDGGSTLAVTLIYTAVFAGWAYSMHSATHGSRGALIAALALNVLVWLMIPVSWIGVYCTGDCPASAGILFNTANWLNLIFGLLAAVGIGLHLRRGEKQA